ncbi:signal transduction histidine kinase [Clostridium pasteurianum DSM 525 = ATCC 6013]|uniref:histidine kinase n=2 Tax=Clostridium pasteurianum TaxID=1501 RepID=A0A0H3IZF7_CLOPA|nr:sensor histidine kinase [Clostridium pasteurianum]AJA46414.1 signal transduction histidine kinase [Clostridium pasteurianum DSM 525 = ATCC 6013]AJA50402.1 signal transduction histidine kinase [Clostridium pasteurianum DSM 525 = ATCC 6013]AOZ77254.1 histidine kinase [Clostridium pasteurianum DSM 525 = ATCC 6013]AOZ81051.1 histidine kinase [Clostridium pasteurianum]ELP60989.1 Membrane associated, signal transduction histidine kinase-like ATPase [Clostridium pasteurianum DSM 525 = ATCC 6013]
MNKIEIDENDIFKMPTIVCIILIYIATLFLQNIRKPSLFASMIFTVVIISYLIIYLFCNTFKARYSVYFVIQGIIIFGAAFIMQKGYYALFMGMIPVLISQGIGFYYDKFKVIFIFLFLYAVFCGTVVIIDGANQLAQTIPFLLIAVIAVVAYSSIFFKQVKLRIHTQKILKELELAYDRVEELTLTNERQRMARDLHDTLSQGLAGVIMQLEAVNANLNKNNTARAQEIVKNAMVHARKTLADSRLVIDDLRNEDNLEIDFVNLIEDEVAKFKNISNIFVNLDINIKSKLYTKVIEYILYIVRECLNNIARHAKAKNVQIDITEKDRQININVIDDGVGFDVRSLDKVYGHYGILGITERVRAIQGKIKIKSEKKVGTQINIIIPAEKGIFNGNE